MVIILNGPPCVGKTHLSAKLCDKKSNYQRLNIYWVNLPALKRSLFRFHIGIRLIIRLYYLRNFKIKLDKKCIKYLFNIERTLYFVSRREAFIIDEGVVQNILSIVFHKNLAFSDFESLYNVYSSSLSEYSRYILIDDFDRLLERRKVRNYPQDKFWTRPDILIYEKQMWKEVMEFCSKDGVKILYTNQNLKV